MNTDPDFSVGYTCSASAAALFSSETHLRNRNILHYGGPLSAFMSQAGGQRSIINRVENTKFKAFFFLNLHMCQVKLVENWKPPLRLITRGKCIRSGIKLIAAQRFNTRIKCTPLSNCQLQYTSPVFQDVFSVSMFSLFQRILPNEETFMDIQGKQR